MNSMQFSLPVDKSCFSTFYILRRLSFAKVLHKQTGIIFQDFNSVIESVIQLLWQSHLRFNFLDTRFRLFTLLQIVEEKTILSCIIKII